VPSRSVICAMSLLPTTSSTAKGELSCHGRALALTCRIHVLPFADSIEGESASHDQYMPRLNVRSLGQSLRRLPSTLLFRGIPTRSKR